MTPLEAVISATRHGVAALNLPERRVGGADFIRAVGLLAVLLLVWVTFQVLTTGLFLSPRNLSTLGVQVAISAILAAGIVMIMVPRNIDLSIGSSVAFCALIAAVVSTLPGISIPVAIVATLGAGLLIGLWQGAWVALMGVPSFVVTLASMLGLRGVILMVGRGESPAADPGMQFIAVVSLPVPITVALVGSIWIGLAAMLVRGRRGRIAAGISVPGPHYLIIQIAVAAVVCVGVVAVAASYRGLPLPVAILLVIAAAVSLLMRHTLIGRHLYAIGGNPEAARLAGISRRSHTFRVFLLMGLLYGVAGLIYVARLGAAPPNAATGLELNVIAAAVIGGTSLFGGIGRVEGAVLGALLMESLNNGMSLLNLPSYYQQIAIGLVLLLAVYLDVRSRKTGLPEAN
jgi:D-xylose transport system permease protein